MSNSFSKCLSYWAILCLILCFSCKKEEAIPSRNICEFVQNDADLDGIIDVVEEALMDYCQASEFTSKASIEANLVGEWELIGHAEAWVGTNSQPCGYITITENQFVFEYQDNFTDTISVHEWSVREFINQKFEIELIPNDPTGATYVNVFCSEYMFSNATPLDGNMYLYRKVN